MSDRIPIEQTVRVVKVGDVDMVVQPLRRSDLNRCAAAAKLGDDFGSRALNAEYIVRLALATKGNEGKTLVDSATGQPVKVRFQAVEFVGTVVTVDVYNAIPEEALVEISTLAQRETLTDAQRGNSSGSPAGSTSSASEPANS